MNIVLSVPLKCASLKRHCGRDALHAHIWSSLVAERTVGPFILYMESYYFLVAHFLTDNLSVVCYTEQYHAVHCRKLMKLLLSFVYTYNSLLYGNMKLLLAIEKQIAKFVCQTCSMEIRWNSYI